MPELVVVELPEEDPDGVDVALLDFVLVEVPVPVVELVPVDVIEAELVPVADSLVVDVELAEAETVFVFVPVVDADDEEVDVALGVEVEVDEELGLAVVVELADGVDVDVDDELVDDVELDVVEELDVEVLEAVVVPVELAVEDASTTVWVSVARGMTSQLVPSEMARNPPPISSPEVVRPMLSAVKSLKITSPPESPATNMATSATLTKIAQSPLFSVEAAGSVNVTCAEAPRVVNTDPK